MTSAAIFSNQTDRVEAVYGQGRRERIAQLCNLHPHVVNDANFAEHAPELRHLEVIFSTWGMPDLQVDRLEAMPRLKAVFYAAGSVQRFARPLIERGIVVVTAAEAIGVFVAQFAASQILLANKGYFQNTRAYSRPGAGKSDAPSGVGNYQQTVGILGAGAVGREVIRVLRFHNLHVLVWDPFLSAEKAAALDVEKVIAIEDAFDRAATVSNHLADAPETRGLVGGALLCRLCRGGAFINTARGGTVNEAELADVMRRRPDLTALLDVQSPEPPRPDSPLYDCPNIWLSSHIAGSTGNERLAFADWIIEQFLAWEQGQPPRGQVTLKMLETMA